VIATANDPVGTGLVASLARPGGNVTGLSNQMADTAAKRLELVQEVVPGLRRLAILGNVGNPGAVLEMGEVQAAARTLGLEVVTLEIRRAEDIGPAFEGAKGRADALYIATDPLAHSSRVRINTLALASRFPTMQGVREYVEAGGTCPMDQTSQTGIDAPPTMSTKFCAGQAWRHSSRAADQVPSRPQPNYRQGARPRGAADAARPRRRGDRIATSCCTCSGLLLALNGRGDT